MDIILICIIVLGVIYIFFDKKKSYNKSKIEYTKTTENSFQEPELYPYKKKYLLTKAEYAFYKILKAKCDERNLLICPKVRLEDFIQVTTKEELFKYRGYIKSRHVDFLICDNKLNIIAAIELDDSSHNTSKAQKTDIFKNHLFHTIQIPLHRIPTSNGTYEFAIDNILQSIQEHSQPAVGQ